MFKHAHRQYSEWLRPPLLPLSMIIILPENCRGSESSFYYGTKENESHKAACTQNDNLKICGFVPIRGQDKIFMLIHKEVKQYNNNNNNRHVKDFEGKAQAKKYQRSDERWKSGVRIAESLVEFGGRFS